jgi:hypothetical protein
MNLHQKLEKNIGWLVSDGQMPQTEKYLSVAERSAFNQIPPGHFTRHPPSYSGEPCSRFSVKPCDSIPEGAIALAGRLSYTPQRVEPGCDHALTVYVCKTKKCLYA